MNPMFEKALVEGVHISESRVSKVPCNPPALVTRDNCDVSFLTGLVQQKVARTLVHGKQAVAAKEFSFARVVVVEREDHVTGVC